MRNKLKQRLASAVCAAAMLLTSIGSSLYSLKAIAVTDTSVAAETNTDELCRQSFELYPSGEQTQKLVKLDGMMPQGATAEAVDVSGDHDAIAAYDITITKDREEFQPSEENPIKVEITDPAIQKDNSIQLWHISDDGEREQITDFTLENGRISFYAKGFSVYEIVTDAGGSTAQDDSGWFKVPSLEKFEEYINDGFCICWYGNSRFAKADYQYNLKNKPKRSGLKVTGLIKDSNSRDLNNSKCNYTELVSNAVSAGAARFYFERSGSSYYIYCYSEGNKKYVANHNETGSYNSLKLVDSKDDAGLYSVTVSDKGYFKIIDSSGFMWNYLNLATESQNGIAAFNGTSNDNNFILWHYKAPSSENDPIKNKTYGLFHYAEGSTTGEALMSKGKNHSLVKLILTAKENNRVLYVDENNEIDRWTFNYDKDNNAYIVSVGTGDQAKYLCADENGISVTDDIDSAGRFSITHDSNNRVQLCSNGYYVTYIPSSDADALGSFGATTDTANEATWLWLLDQADLTDDDYITFSADRVSVSDIQNGEKVIVYIRIWNEQDLKYDIYAVNANGTLYPCYASGGKIMWLGGGTNSLEWEFTEYLDAVTKQPNYYYELYNPYSEKYIAPQMNGNQVLSGRTIGINMPGRRNGEFYSAIIAWDDSRYAYIGLRPNESKTALEPCSESVSYPFYFARLEELNQSDRLHTVPTVDNTVHGITMKMKDFTGTSGGSGATQQNAYIKDTSFFTDKANKGLLSNYFPAGEYPTAVKTDTSIEELYEGAETVNHLFLESVYNSSGYFEYDSTQNFATLAATNDGNFTVYRELGSVDGESKSTLEHGQFFPYNTIAPGEYSASNPLNLYNTDARTNDTTRGKLSDDDPRKYEKLYTVGHKDGANGQQKVNYYFGMEMEAEFVQTVSGLDAWGHDIIFEFKGDDDFWLYVDGELVIDLGGIHSALDGKVNFRTGEVEVNGTKTTLRKIYEDNFKARGVENYQQELDEIFDTNENGQYIFKDYTKHKMRVFYMERGAGASNLYMRFNIASVTPGHVVVSKSLSGEGASLIDKDFVEYPFQIYYRLPDGEGGAPGEERLLANDYEHIAVTYQNSNQPVTFVKRYRPPGFTDEEAYENIYFINPSKNAEIAFPENTISYRIVECAVDSSVYGSVLINGNAVPEEQITHKGNLISYSSRIGTSEERPSISFDNVVNANVIKDLKVTKLLLDENDQEITDDPATFSFRLYVSSVDPDSKEMPLANMAKYCVLSPNKKVCRYDYENACFAETQYEFDHEFYDDISNNRLSDVQFDDVVFRTSGFGSISGIPSGYTICVPGITVGSVFKITEDDKTGYGLMGYERINGSKTNADGTVEDIPSYLPYNDNPWNMGRAIAAEDPQLNVINKKGYGLKVNKKWSDLDITTSHAPIYVAVYVKGELLENSVKQIKSPDTSAYYFWTSLKPYANGRARTDLADYEVREVTISADSPTVAQDGTVSGYGTVTPIESGGSVSLTATRTSNATPQGESSDKDFNYFVSYSQGMIEGSSRTDTITNTRESGIAIRLFKWDTNEPLQNGKFTLTDSLGNKVGEFTSNADGIVSMLYSYEPDQIYTLTQTCAPQGYVGLQKPVCFKVNPDETVSLFYSDGTTPWGKNDRIDLRWANGKQGENGITAFVDVYNKQFNFKIMKMDSKDSNILLGSAHFAVYKQANTTISGYVKNRDPMDGFEDLVTYNGVVDICGGDSGRVINPGEKGAVFFLTETKAPFNYTKLDQDIIFRISPLGIPSLISDSYSGRLVETDDSYIYTLSVPNTKADPSLKTLTISKQVKGAFGNKNQEFDFTVTITGAGEGAGFVWAKNGEQQDLMPRTGGTFTLRHSDKVEISLPIGVEVTVEEVCTDYSQQIVLNDGEPEDKSSTTFTFTDSTDIVVINTLEGSVATGITLTFVRSATLALLPMMMIAAFVYRRKKRKNEA